MEKMKMINVLISVPCKNNPDTILLKNKRYSDDVNKLKNENIAIVDLEESFGNKLSLSEFGNKAIYKALEKNYDYLILMHSDVDLSIYDFVKNLIKTKDKYDIVGLVGTKKLFISQSPLTWFTGSNKFTKERYGRITQNVNGMMLESFFNRENPNVLDTEVITIDGLLMCLNRKTMLNEKARFDEQFTFDFYDLDFCMNVQLNTDLKIGVFVQQAIHESIGKSVLSDKYLIPERKFRIKWNCLLQNQNQ